MPVGEKLIQDIEAHRASSGAFAFWWLGQAGVVLSIGGKVIAIDPYLSPDARRLSPPPLSPDQLTNVDAVLCTHDHADHIDPGALPGIAEASPSAALVVPRTAIPRVCGLGIPEERVMGINANEELRFGDVRVTAIAAQHEFFDRTPEGDFPYLGYVVSSGAHTVYHAGDTLCYDGLLRRLRELAPTVAFLPINGRDAARYAGGCIGNMTYQEAVDLAGLLDVDLAVPIHHGMFEGNTKDPALFAAYLKAKFPGMACWIGGVGARVEVSNR